MSGGRRVATWTRGGSAGLPGLPGGLHLGARVGGGLRAGKERVLLCLATLEHHRVLYIIVCYIYMHRYYAFGPAALQYNEGTLQFVDGQAPQRVASSGCAPYCTPGVMGCSLKLRPPSAPPLPSPPPGVTSSAPPPLHPRRSSSRCPRRPFMCWRLLDLGVPPPLRAPHGRPGPVLRPYGGASTQGGIGRTCGHAAGAGLHLDGQPGGVGA